MLYYNITASVSLAPSGDVSSSNDGSHEVAGIGGLPSESRAWFVQVPLDHEPTEEDVHAHGDPSCLLQSCHAFCSG